MTLPDREGIGGPFITLTEPAAHHARRYLEEDGLPRADAFPRPSALPDGCSGFEYGVEITLDRGRRTSPLPGAGSRPRSIRSALPTWTV